MGRGTGSPVALPPRFCHLSPQTLPKQELVGKFFCLSQPLSDPYPAKPAEEETAAAAADDQDDDFYAHSFCDEDDLFSRDDLYDDLYDDRWETLADEAEGYERPTRRHVSRERLAVERTAGRQRHLHVNVRQVRRAERKTAQRQAAVELRRARVLRPLQHAETAPGAVEPCAAAYHVRSVVKRAQPARRGASSSSWEPSPTAAAAVLQTATGRRVQLSREEQEIAAAIQASLAVDANAAGGLSMEQLSELLTRDLSPNDYEMLLRLDETVAKKTLAADKIEQLLPTRTATADDTVHKCTICQCEYETGDALRVTPCAHLFHADCITAWLSKSSTKCALCNKAIEGDA